MLCLCKDVIHLSHTTLFLFISIYRYVLNTQLVLPSSFLSPVPSLHDLQQSKPQWAISRQFPQPVFDHRESSAIPLISVFQLEGFIVYRPVPDGFSERCGGNDKKSKWSTLCMWQENAIILQENLHIHINKVMKLRKIKLIRSGKDKKLNYHGTCCIRYCRNFLATWILPALASRRAPSNTACTIVILIGIGAARWIKFWD